MSECTMSNVEDCVYHNAFRLMEEAQENLDFNEYFTQRAKVEALDAVGWDEAGLTPNVASKRITLAEMIDFIEAYPGETADFVEALLAEPTLNTPDFGMLASFENEPGSEDSSDMWVVFTNGTQYWRIEGDHSSWADDEWWLSSLTEVALTQDVVIKYSYRPIN